MSLLERIYSVGLSYQQYVDLFKKELGAIAKDYEETDYETKRINLQRMKRIEKHYLVPNDLKILISQINKQQLWIIISETWCGDSAQNIPYIAKIIELNPIIKLKIILRDANPDIMDLHLTNGKRSIPMLVVFSGGGQELFKWGSRPQEAKKLVDELIEQGVEKAARLKKLHLWYGRNGGKNLEQELINAIRNTL